MISQKNQNKLTVIEHLEELRKRILISLVFFLVFSISCLFFADKLMQLLQLPAKIHIDKFFLIAPSEVLSVYIKIALYFGAALSLPFVLFNVWLYIKPALPNDLGISIWLWIVFIIILFILGIFFSYFLFLPFALKFLINLSSRISTPMFNLNSYISFALSVLVATGIIFEMPVVIGLLTKVRIVSPILLRKKRKEAVVGLLTFAAIITPTTDVFNMILFFVPMWVLYEISIIISFFIYKKSLISEVEVVYDKTV